MKELAKIHLAGGCFWGTEHFFKQVRGVVSVTPVYANGNIENPTYEEVCSDTTGFAEAVEITYDLNAISLRKILQLFFITIDPTSLNQQGNDIGSQYRTGIYYQNEKDKIIAESALKRLAKHYAPKPLVVECEPLKNVFVAEESHQDYLEKKPNAYCHVPFGAFIAAKRGNPIKLQNKRHKIHSFKKQLTPLIIELKRKYNVL